MTSSSPSIIIYAAYYSMLLLYFVSSWFPEYRVWSFNWWAYYPLWVRISLVIAGALVPVASARWANFSNQQKGPTSSDRRYWLWVTTLGVIFIALFVLLRARTHFLGDGYLMISDLTTTHAGRFYTIVGDKIRAVVFGLLSGTPESKALLTFQLISYMSGILSLAGFAVLAKYMAAGTVRRLLIFLALATGGYSLIFFGYVETYPPFLFSWVLFSVVALLIAERRVVSYWIFLPLGLSLLFHIFAVALIPATVYLLLHRSPIAHSYARLSYKTRWALLSVVVLIGLVGFSMLYSKSLYFRYALMPPVANEVTVDGYTLFSAAHLLDIVNLVFVLVPGLLVFGAVLSRSGRKPEADIFARVLGLMAICALLIGISFHPNLGLSRDWDLYSFAGVPLLVLLIRTTMNRPGQQHLVVLALVIALGVAVLIPRAVAMVVPEVAIAHFNSYVKLDPAMNRSGVYLLIKYYRQIGDNQTALRIDEQSWSDYPVFALQQEAIQLRHQGHYHAAIAKYREAAKYNARVPDVYTGLARSYLGLGQIDEALQNARIADALNPNNATTLHTLGKIYAEQGDVERAIDLFQRTQALGDTTGISGMDLTMAYLQIGDTISVMKQARKLNDNSQVPQGFFLNLAVRLIGRGNSSQAREVWTYALQRGADSPEVQAVRERYPDLQ